MWLAVLEGVWRPCRRRDPGVQVLLLQGDLRRRGRRVLEHCSCQDHEPIHCVAETVQGPSEDLLRACAACVACVLAPQQLAQNVWASGSCSSNAPSSHPDQNVRHGSLPGRPAGPSARSKAAARQADETHVKGVSSEARRAGARGDSSAGCAIWDRHPPRSRKDVVNSGQPEPPEHRLGAEEPDPCSEGLQVCRGRRGQPRALDCCCDGRCADGQVPWFDRARVDDAPGRKGVCARLCTHGFATAVASCGRTHIDARSCRERNC